MLKSKIKSRAALKIALDRARRSGRKVVFTNGCFDILHYGHVRYLEQAARCGDVLVVGVNSDASVRRLKGLERPVNTERDRAGVIAALDSVDYVTIFGEDTPLALIRLLKPDVLVKGSDWKPGEIVGSDVVLKRRGVVRTVPLERGRSTSSVIQKILHGCRSRS